MKMRLSWRLFISYAAVAVVGGVVAYLTISLLAPRLFEDRLGMAMNSEGNGMSMGTMDATSVRSAFVSALTTSLLVGVLASVAAAGFVAAAVTGRLLRPLNAVRAATKLIAAGKYGGRVPVPSEPELAALATDVNTLAEALADTESRRTRLLGEVAHEMRTPLTVLDGYVEGLIDGVFSASPDTFASLSEELRRLHRLSDDLSSLSRAQEQRLDLHPTNEDLADLAHRAAARLLPQFDDSDITLNVDADTALPVQVDPDRITQVLTNLLGNALHATPAGGAVTITARAVGSRGEVSVTDTGVGLAPDDTERVFERFYRVPGQGRRSAGSGIGLTIAREIARGHGGDITAASAGRGQGATFVVTVPLRATDQSG
ncbi:HAMP domain-containing histidine kinase [Cryobacterium sp. TMT1-21]|uniref:sensor histidine kinase n=1 Tax=unclassified Cryobacterium TaxID=2649013 RepID=UPI00106DD0E3|nr:MULTISPECIES: HAMP domain-containing sensor histidine kinase [unclassified Cryobacterium]TFC84479.1 HAMP domain-containing histidine kinase [Cryobacterium sp. TmT2-59]TFD15388.1 HAMP domain-containing histidine kinase [Cryobacterium sp. TMT4-10]TFD17533.1 HAMP domain-containing histidine kinase [Cryobacterium sp. TMT1-21]TFD22005.1 HAMP domain-containing histidine kinase [Cryobacterium sp. TMT2-23]